MSKSDNTRWYKVAESDELGADRASTVTAGVKGNCLGHYQGRYLAVARARDYDGPALTEVMTDVQLV